MRELRSRKERTLMHKRIVWIILAVVAMVGVGGTIALANNGDSEGGVRGPEAERAAQAALEITGGGTANAVERDGEGGATWEVEVTTAAGTTVDVRLDDTYQLVMVDGDLETVDDGDAAG
jgi:hypothetical protein